MGIKVFFSNGTFQTVSKSVLDNLIESQEILAFRRSSGWAIIGVHPLREKRRSRSTAVQNTSCGHPDNRSIETRASHN